MKKTNIKFENFDRIRDVLVKREAYVAKANTFPQRKKNRFMCLNGDKKLDLITQRRKVLLGMMKMFEILVK